MSDTKPTVKKLKRIWVESILSDQEWADSHRNHPNTHHLKEKPQFFKSDYEWRWRMGDGIPQDERDLINKRLQEMRKKVKNDN